MTSQDNSSESSGIPRPRTAQELHQAAVELMKKKHQDMGLIEEVIR